MGWRYQPVVRVCEIPGVTDVSVSMCEVFLDENDRLKSWTEDMQSHPMGANIDELTGDLAMMLVDALCWKPVLEAELRVGMSFERAVDQKTRNEIAEFIDLGGSLLKMQQI